MTDRTVDDVESVLARARDADDADALDLLRDAREDVRRLRAESTATDRQDRLDDLETRIDQHVAAVRNRDAYDARSGASSDGEQGAAMEPDDENAP